MSDVGQAIRSDLAMLDLEVEIVKAGIAELRSETESENLLKFNVMGLAGAIDSRYSGCERVLSLVAARIDRAPISKTGAWHAELIERMANSHEDRPAVLAADTRELLDSYRSFRHRVRSNYGSRLDPVIVQERAAEASRLATIFRRDIEAFLDARTSD